LLVEDHPDTARVMGRLLGESGYLVSVAHSVASALEFEAAESFDLVISDIGLPDATGDDLMRELKTPYGMRGIALSGYGMEDDLRRGREAGSTIT
jgi:CheY-like chemotaxis protein